MFFGDILCSRDPVTNLYLILLRHHSDNSILQLLILQDDVRALGFQRVKGRVMSKFLPRYGFHPADHKTKLFLQRLQILLPFSGEEIFFFVVALLARRHEIPLHRLPAAHDWDQMIHGQINGFELASAIVADA